MGTLISIHVTYDSVESENLVREVVRLQSLTLSSVATTPVVLAAAGSRADGLLGLIGVGKELWAGEDAQDYVNRLRSEWR